MLIQIEEPQPPRSLPLDNFAIGIDLGTTHTVVSYIDQGQAKILRIDGNPLIPSVISYDSDGTFTVGQKKDHLFEPSKLVFSSFKSHMDRPSDKIANLKTPVELSAHLLRYIKSRAEEILKRPIDHAVITVPAYFDDTARQATKDAASLAGLTVLRLINEPTAAALAYGLDQQIDEGTYAVYDWGGGTFDISLLKIRKGIFQVLSTAGDTHLGGDDIDHAIVDYWTRTSPVKNIPIALARQGKEALSLTENWADSEKGLSLSLEELTTLSDPFIKRTLNICKNALNDAKLTQKDIKNVIFVGGMTRLKPLKTAVEAFFKTPPLTNLNPDEIVAQGAAFQAFSLTEGLDSLLLDVNPLSLGIEVMGGIVEKIIPRNTPIPMSISQDFTTHQSGQTAIKIHVVQGERDMVEDCRSLGEFTLTGIPPMQVGMVKIRVTFSLDSDGLLNVKATEVNTQTSQSITVKPSYGLTENNLKEILQKSFQEGAEDLKKRHLIETQIKARQTIEVLKIALNDSNHLLSPSENKKFTKILSDLESIILRGTTHTIEKKVLSVSQKMQPFLEKRMALSLQKHLNKKSFKNYIIK